MSPTARLEDWHQQHSANSREHDDPVLLRVTPHHPQHQLQHQHSHPSHHQQPNQQQSSDLPKSHSVDALHQRIEERNSVHSSEVIGKLSHELTKKLQATENRSRPESNNNNNINNNTIKTSDCSDLHRNGHAVEKKQEFKERLSPQSVEVLNDRNRQLERERRKLAASCEPVSQTRLLTGPEASSQGIEDFYRERSATIEMTSRNVELLNRRNAIAEKRLSSGSNMNVSSSGVGGGSSSNTSTMTEHQCDLTLSNSMIHHSKIENCDLRNHSLLDKPPPPVSSPPRSPDQHCDVSPASLRSPRGAIPRRSGSSSSSASTGSSNEAVQSSRSSPLKSQMYLNEGCQIAMAKNHLISRRKISSPTQTENNWTGSNSPRARSSQTEGSSMITRLRRNSSMRSRSSSLSSASKLSTSSSSSSGSPRYSPVNGKNSSPCVSPQPGIEGLTLVQRTEICLRVNTTTSDAASQTEVFEDDDGDGKVGVENQIEPEPRRKLPEEIECEELSRDLASQLGPNDKLVEILGELWGLRISRNLGSESGFYMASTPRSDSENLCLRRPALVLCRVKSGKLTILIP